MPGSAACSGRCEQVHCRGEPATICPATTHVSSHAPSEGNATGSLCRLADGLSGTVARTQCLLHQRILVLLLFRQTLYLYLSKILRLCYCNCLHHLHGCNCHPHHHYHIHILKPFIYSMGVDSSKSMPLHISVFNYFPSPSFYSPCWTHGQVDNSVGRLVQKVTWIKVLGVQTLATAERTKTCHECRNKDEDNNPSNENSVNICIYFHLQVITTYFV